jgi:hypothetical protein
MRTKYTVALFALASVLTSSAAIAWDQDPFEQYVRRSDTITFGAGDAKEVNSGTHVIDPWPPYAGNRQIPGNGERMSDAVQRYRDVSKLPQAPRPLGPQSGDSGGGYPGMGGGSTAAPTGR